jgi:hypothetical protein
MSKSVIVAIIAVAIIFLERVVLGVMAVAAGTSSVLNLVLTGGISGLILVGVIKGHKLAWQWGRILGMVGAVILSFIAIMLITHSNPQNVAAVVIIGSQAILLYILFFTLGTAGARKYFHLICPVCGSTKAKAADFLFAKAKCKDCDNQW